MGDPKSPTVFDPNSLSVGVDNPNAIAIFGINTGTKAKGFFAGPNTMNASQPIGAYGESNSIGVLGIATSEKGIGVAGTSPSGVGIGVQGHTSHAIGVLGTCDGPGLAGKFGGNVEVTGDIVCSGPKSTIGCFDVNLGGGDCAEDFDIDDIETVDPGTVMVINDRGALQQSRESYDKRVAGVISGAGDYKPGIVLDKQGSRNDRRPIALMGKVFCKVDAQYGAIEVGDLLTTSPTPGCAMKATNQLEAFGAIIGKTLRALPSGQGLIPILVALQ